MLIDLVTGRGEASGPLYKRRLLSTLVEEYPGTSAARSVASGAADLPNLPESPEWHRLLVAGSEITGFSHGEFPSYGAATHPGFDIGLPGQADCGLPVTAAGTGSIVRVVSTDVPDSELAQIGIDQARNDRDLDRNTGNAVILRHGEGSSATYSIYLHLQDTPSDSVGVPWRVGMTIPAGAQIGKIGETGAANGCHLHFEARNFEGTYKYLHPTYGNIYPPGDISNTEVFVKDWIDPESFLRRAFLARHFGTEPSAPTSVEIVSAPEEQEQPKQSEEPSGPVMQAWTYKTKPDHLVGVPGTLGPVSITEDSSVRLDGLTVMKAGIARARTHLEFFWEPDGKRVVIFQKDADLGDLQAIVVDMEQGTPIILDLVPENKVRGVGLPDQTHQPVGATSWSPDGRYVAFPLARKGWDADLLVIDMQEMRSSIIESDGYLEPDQLGFPVMTTPETIAGERLVFEIGVFECAVANCARPEMTGERREVQVDLETYMAANPGPGRVPATVPEPDQEAEPETARQAEAQPGPAPEQASEGHTTGSGGNTVMTIQDASARISPGETHGPVDFRMDSTVVVDDSEIMGSGPDPSQTRLEFYDAPDGRMSLLIQVDLDWGGIRAAVIDMENGVPVFVDIIPEDRVRGMGTANEVWQVRSEVVWSPDGRYVAVPLSDRRWQAQLLVIDAQDARSALIGWEYNQTGYKEWGSPNMESVRLSDAVLSLTTVVMECANEDCSEAKSIGTSKGTFTIEAMMQDRPGPGRSPTEAAQASASSSALPQKIPGDDGVYIQTETGGFMEIPRIERYVARNKSTRIGGHSVSLTAFSVSDMNMDDIPVVAADEIVSFIINGSSREFRRIAFAQAISSYYPSTPPVGNLNLAITREGFDGDLFSTWRFNKRTTEIVPGDEVDFSLTATEPSFPQPGWAPISAWSVETSDDEEFVFFTVGSLSNYLNHDHQYAEIGLSDQSLKRWNAKLRSLVTDNLLQPEVMFTYFGGAISFELPLVDSIAKDCKLKMIRLTASQARSVLEPRGFVTWDIKSGPISYIGYTGLYMYDQTWGRELAMMQTLSVDGKRGERVRYNISGKGVCRIDPNGTETCNEVFSCDPYDPETNSMFFVGNRVHIPMYLPEE